MLAQTWSEHCKHKIFASKISYTDKEAGTSETINSLYKTCIMNTTKQIRESLGDRDFCRSVFKDNAGVIAFTPEYDACIKVETHNSPSALDPYGGALTGIVGVNRDPETGKLCGDVDFAAIEPKASVITPVPGGVGPMTICCLMENTIECFLRRAGR